MFEFISEKMTGLMQRIGRERTMTEDNIAQAVKDVRMALLEADVNFQVVKRFIQSLKEKVQGEAVTRSVTPGQQFIKVVHDELVVLLGGEISQEEKSPEEIKKAIEFKPELLSLDRATTKILFCGLQGSGKTTHCAKLAKLIEEKIPGKKVLIAACDRQRPKAIEQLKILAKETGAVVFDQGNTPQEVAKGALEEMQNEGYSVLIIDTAGRQNVDDELMQELKEVYDLINPDECLFVANATMGQEIAKTAKDFHDLVPLTGSILTMLDSDAKGGAVLSIGMMTGCSIKLEGIGEKLGDLQLFNPHSMADRILGMGDTINLVRKMQDQVSEEDAKQMEKKLMNASFTYNDYLKQAQSVKKMGSLGSLMKMMPGASQMDIDEKQFLRVEAIILSMTPDERSEKVKISVSRRKRIAKGCGLPIEEVHKLVKNFENTKKFFKKMPNPKKLKKLIGGMQWR